MTSLKMTDGADQTARIEPILLHVRVRHVPNWAKGYSNIIIINLLTLLVFYFDFDALIFNKITRITSLRLLNAH